MTSLNNYIKFELEPRAIPSRILYRNPTFLANSVYESLSFSLAFIIETKLSKSAQSFHILF